jgi:hypothetical protein
MAGAPDYSAGIYHPQQVILNKFSEFTRTLIISTAVGGRR